MAIAWDASVELVRTGTSDPATWTHTPTGVPRAIVVAIVHGTSSTDHVSTVTYGGVSMAEVVRATDTATEPGAAELWFLGTGIPTGNQTVSVDLASATTDDIHFTSMSFTADIDTMVVDFDSINNNATDPSVTLQYNGRTCLSVAALYGGGASPSSFTQNGNCTSIQDHDLGAFYSEVIRQTTPGTADFAIGGTAAADDVAYVALAVSEIYGVLAASGSYAITGTDATLTWVGQIHLKASANIAASAATATTARLTAPSGKSTSDFVAGKISDDTNPLPTIDITTDDYTELEWCIEALAGLTATDVYEFRVLAEGAVLDTYTVNPTWTIGANSYSLAADSGSYAITGTATGIARQISLVPDSGIYDVTGTAQTLTLARKLVLDPGAYDVTGTATGTYAGYKVTADSGSYDITGTSQGLYAGPATQLGIVQQPSGAVAGSTLTTQPWVTTLNQYSLAVPSSGVIVTAAIVTPGVGTLGGDTTAEIATDSTAAYFTDLSLSAPQDSIVLRFTSPGLTSVDSDPFEVTGNGTLVPDSGSYALTGTDVTLTYTESNNYSIVPDSGVYDVTGTVAGLYAGWKVIPDLGTYVVTGTDTGALFGAKVAAASGAYALTGTDATLTHRLAVYLSASANIGAGGTTATTARLTAPSGKSTSDFVAGKISDDTNPLPTVDITTDDYTELEWSIATSTGLTATDVYEFRVVDSADVVLDTYTVTPTWTIGSNAYSMAADPGSYNVTGTDVGTYAGYLLAADPGSYAVTGTDVTLVVSRPLTAESGSYAITGTAAALTPQAVDGIYLITGTAAGLTWNHVIQTDSGGYVWTGVDTTLTWQAKLTLDPGSYAVSGVDANLVFEPVGDYTIVANSGDYALTGSDISMTAPHNLIIEEGVYLVTGTAVGLFVRRVAVAESGAYAITGTTVTLLYGIPGDYTLVAAPGAYLIRGRPLDMRYGNICPEPRTNRNRHPRLKPFVAGSH